jgi:hypothetical protein
MPTTPTCVEYTVAGISSLSVQEITQRVVESDDLLTAVGLGTIVPDFDQIVTDASPHYVYAKSKAYGIAIVEAKPEEIQVHFLEVTDVTNPAFNGNVARTSFRTPAGSAAIEML